jgi:ketosteroid isomerase-like protein
MNRHSIVMMLLMTLLMGIVLSAVFTWQARGLAIDFASQWADRFIHTYPVVLPTVLVIAPIAQRLATAFAPAAVGTTPEGPGAGNEIAVALAAWRANAAGYRGEGFDDWLARLAPDVSITMPLGPFRGVNKGIDKARAIYALIDAAQPRLMYEEPSRISSSAGCVVIEFVDAGTIAGQPYCNRIAASFDIRDGRVTAYREYFGDIDPHVVALMNSAGDKRPGRSVKELIHRSAFGCL